MLFISYILFYHIFSYTILYCQILYICVFTLTIELTFTIDSRGNLIMFVIPYIFILYFSYTILSYDFHILYFHIICHIHFVSLTLYFLYLYTCHILFSFIYYTCSYTFHVLYVVLSIYCHIQSFVLFIYFYVLCTFHILSYFIYCHLVLYFLFL